MKKTDRPHIPVLAEECLEALRVSSGNIFIDGTFGRGGHTQLILDHLTSSGQVFAFDQDQAAIDAGQSLLKSDARLQLVHAPFSSIEDHLPKEIVGQVDGVLLDIGVSSPQLDVAERGFSFMRDGPLDMRMDQSQPKRAFDYLLYTDEAIIAADIETYGEERYAKRIAKAIVNERRASRLKDSTHYLAELVISCGVRRERNKHPATRTFQALRMAVNDEVGELEKGLLAASKVLTVGGRLAVISFHGLEHRIVKAFVREFKKPNDQVQVKLMGKAVGASREEVRKNVRSRSAYLRIIERIA